MLRQALGGLCGVKVFFIDYSLELAPLFGTDG